MRQFLGSATVFTAIFLGSPCVLAQTTATSPESATVSTEQSLELANEYSSRGHALYEAGDADAALPLFYEALRLRREILGERHPDSLESLNNYAFVLNDLGRAQEAEQHFGEVLRLHREVLGERHPITLISLHNYGEALEELGRAGEAERFHAEALRLSREVLGGDDPDLVNSISSYAAVLLRLGRAVEAEPLFAEALRLHRALLGELDPLTSVRLNNYAVVLNALGRSDKAERLYAEALHLTRKQYGERHPATLTSLHNYGSVLYSLGRSIEAEPFHAEALRLRRMVRGDDHPETLESILGYAVVLSELGRTDEAKPLFAEAFERSRRVLGETHPRTLKNTFEYALALWKAGDKAAAASRLAEALAAQREVLGPNHAETFSSQTSYALMLQDLGRVDEALALSRELTGLVRARASDLSAGGLRGMEQGKRELADRQRAEQIHANLLWDNFVKGKAQDGLAAEAFTALQLASAGSASRAVADAAAARFAAEAGQAKLVEERRQLVRQWPVIEAALVDALGNREDAAAQRGALQKQADAIEARIAIIDARLADLAPQYFAIQNQQAVTLDGLRALLDDREAVLLLVPTDIGTHSLVITRETLRWHRADADQQAINIAVRKLRDGLEVTDPPFLPLFDLELAYQLYRDLIAPVEDALAGKQRVYVIPEGDLSRFPPGVMLTSPPAPGSDFEDPDVLRNAPWLADRYALVQLPSVQSLAYIRTFGGTAPDPEAEDAEYLGFGDPVLAGKPAWRGVRDAALAPIETSILLGLPSEAEGTSLMDPDALRRLASLPGTRSELQTVQRALGARDTALFLADRMTEATFRSADFSQTRILHLATHGLTSEEAGYLAEPGLVFTPPAAALRGDDGYLAASEIVGVDLSAVQWAILSACNTAAPSGRQGEAGLSGLAQAFFYAGAKSLLVSHWPVFDDIAPVITVEMLTAAQSGMPRAEALQTAMRLVRLNPALGADHPARWAPFALVGEGR